MAWVNAPLQLLFNWVGRPLPAVSVSINPWPPTIPPETLFSDMVSEHEFYECEHAKVHRRGRQQGSLYPSTFLKIFLFIILAFRNKVHILFGSMVCGKNTVVYSPGPVLGHAFICVVVNSLCKIVLVQWQMVHTKHLMVLLPLWLARLSHLTQEAEVMLHKSLF